MASTHARDRFYGSRQIDTTLDRSAARTKIAADTAAFTSAGGRVQNLGSTPLREKDRGDDPTMIPPSDRAYIGILTSWLPHAIKSVTDFGSGVSACVARLVHRNPLRHASASD
jgi:hypothetical protein